MCRVIAFSYGVVAYAACCGTFLYAIGFLGNVLAPESTDAAFQEPLAVTLLANLLLLGAFALPHCVMARPTFTRWWARCVRVPVERSTYALLSSLSLMLVFWQWRPIPGMIWEVDGTVGRAVLYSVFAFGWLLVVVSSFLINHLDLVGLRQAWLYLRGRECTPVGFSTPWLYRHVRHPMYVGWFCAFWATPRMTATHLAFAVAITAYILVAVRLEERNLVELLPEYASYRRQIPMFVPRIGKRRWSAGHVPAKPTPGAPAMLGS